MATHNIDKRGSHAPPPTHPLLNSLASCLMTSLVAHAVVRGIGIQELESEVEGDIDLRGFLGISSDVPRGYTDIRMKFKVKADCDDMERLKDLAEYSPVFNTLTNGPTWTFRSSPGRGKGSLASRITQ